MILRHFLAIFGLLSDLVGAFLLSVPMIWNTRRVALRLIRSVHRTRFYIYGPAYYRKPPPPINLGDETVLLTKLRLAAVSTLFMVTFLIIGVRLITVVMSKRSNRVWLTIDSSPDLITSVGFLLIAGAGLLACYCLVRLPEYAARLSIWIVRGNRERNVGIVGLVILVVGFVLQAWLNLIQ
jgi:hypothetical protein